MRCRTMFTTSSQASGDLFQSAVWQLEIAVWRVDVTEETPKSERVQRSCAMPVPME